MKKLCLLALPLLAVALPSQAAAQDAAASAGGFRIDLMTGFDSVRANVEGDANNDTFRGVAYGAGIGYDMPMGAITFGVDAEVTFATTDRTVTQGEVTLGRDLYVGGRLTGHLSNSLSVYGKLGYTNLRFHTDLNDGQVAPNLDVLGSNLNGVRGAVGIQISADEDANGVYYGVEGRYSNYESGVSRRQAMLVIGTRF